MARSLQSAPMPELPEVETLRRDLEAHVLGATIRHVTVTGKRSVRRQRPAELSAQLEGRRLAHVQRFGKYLVVALDPGRSWLVCHLRMSGRLQLARSGGEVLAPHTHVRLDLGRAGELRFVDPRTFGELFVTEELDARGRPRALADLGPDVLSEEIDLVRLATLAARRQSAIKSFLLDQRVLAGIGNLYADEICHVARLRPTRAAASLRRGDLVRLIERAREVFEAAVGARGSTLADGGYGDLFGRPGRFQLEHAVYGRAGQPCRSCGSAIELVRIAGRSSHFCPSCQH